MSIRSIIETARARLPRPGRPPDLQALRQMGLRGILRPGVTLLNRLRYPAKFGLIALVSMVAIGFFVVSLMFAMYSELSAARDELAGLGVWEPAARAAQRIQHSVGQAAAISAGDESLKSGAAAQRAQVDTALQELDRAIATSGLGLHDRSRAVAAEWQSLRGKLDGTAAKDMAEAYKPLNALLQDFMRELGESSQAISDASPQSAYLADVLVRKIPQINDTLAALRVQGGALLISRELDMTWRALGTLHGVAARNARELGDVLRRDGVANPARKASLEAALAPVDRLQAALLELAERELVKASFGVPAGDYDRLAGNAIDAYYALGQVLLPPLKTTLAFRIEQLEARFWTNTVIAALIVLLLAYVSLAMFVSVLDSVEELSEGAKRIGEGDLRARIRFSAHDELRAVADQFNGMAENFAGVIGGVKRTARELSESAQALAASADRVTRGSAQQSEAASSMAAAIEEMTVGVDEISRHASSAENCSQETGQLSVQGGMVVQDTVAEMERIAEAVNESAEVIRDLGRNSTRIHDIVNSIKEIADQTNLLALNASIEAARAGEDGRGFAVVADEVRKLAERTTKATQEIAGMVGGIQGGTNRAVAAMQDGVARVREGVVLTQQAGRSMEQIRAESERVVKAVEEISMALREQASASTEIAQNVERIAAMAEENGSVVGATADTASQLERLARTLDTEIGRFRV